MSSANLKKERRQLIVEALCMSDKPYFIEFETNLAGKKEIGLKVAEHYISDLKIGYQCYQKMINQFERVYDVAILIDAFEKNITHVIERYKKASKRDTFFISISPTGDFKDGWTNAAATKNIATTDNVEAIKNAILEIWKSKNVANDCEVFISTKSRIYVFDSYRLVDDAENGGDVLKQILEAISIV